MRDGEGEPRIPPAAHWSERWLGRRARDGYDCADFVAEVMRAEFGVEVPLPGVHAASTRARDRQIALGAGALADPVDDPRDGDAVLMRSAGRLRSLGHHVGVWCAPGGTPSALHLLAGVGSVATPLAGLAGVGLELGGVYRWRT